MDSQSPQLPVLETHRLVLKPVTLADAPAYQMHVLDYEVARYLSRSFPWPHPENGAETFIRDVILPSQGEGKWVWGLHLKSESTGLIGVIDL